jgi:biotin carboxyl carrier protein
MSATKREIKVTISGREYLVEVEDLDARPIIAVVEGERFEVYTEETDVASPALREARAAQPAPSHEPVAVGAAYVTAPMPGDITDIYVSPGGQVSVGQELCSLEAMKMKNSIRSPRAGTVKSIEVAPGQAVAYGDVLIVFEGG